MAEATVNTSLPRVDSSTLKRAVTAGIIGHFVEWYDYGVYALMATTLAVVFFDSSNPTVALLSVFATFAVAFFARPIGGLFFGSLGDRLGRQKCLAIVVILISLSTFIIGILPGYASIGALAPLLLLIARIFQGFSAGGEIAGAATFINEYAPNHRRGMLSSLLPAASATGLLFGVTLIAILTTGISEEGMVSWGWRIPFLIALPLGLVGLYLRIKIEDTPMFRALVAEAEADSAPIQTSITSQFKWIAVAFGATLTYGVGFYVVMSYAPAYLSEVTDFDSRSRFIVLATLLIAHIIALPLWGGLSDRIGRKPVLMLASVGLVFLSYPCFLLIGQESTVLFAVIGGTTLSVLIAAGAAPLFAYMAEMFPTRVRTSSVSIGYNASVMMFGGTAPFIATFLIDRTGSPTAPSFYLVAAAAGAVLTLALAPKTKTSHRTTLRQT